MSDREKILSLLAKHAKKDSVGWDEKLFGSGINLSSISYAEFIFDFEEVFDVEIDEDGLDSSIDTVGKFVEHLETLI